MSKQPQAQGCFSNQTWGDHTTSKPAVSVKKRWMDLQAAKETSTGKKPMGIGPEATRAK
jgi:hypothetical protein